MTENESLQEVSCGWSITTNLGFKGWGSVFPGAACVVALVDRFSQHLHTVDIDAESWRQTKNEPPPKQTKKKPKR